MVWTPLDIQDIPLWGSTPQDAGHGSEYDLLDAHAVH